jgi:hypothetical protein
MFLPISKFSADALMPSPRRARAEGREKKQRASDQLLIYSLLNGVIVKNKR